ncbi:MAG: hypothetical protein JXX14_01320, partial [Deltaproteobacteria bacterium]|nr:hypothetical protein [Deltaproteobacteria bacterium]
MTTFFLQRGIRISTPKPASVTVTEIDLACETDSPSSLDFSLENRFSQFRADGGHTVVLRLADVDPYCQAQRAEVSLIRDNDELAGKAVAALKTRTGMAD